MRVDDFHSLFDHWRAGDAAAAAAFFAPDGVYHERRNGPVRGRDAIVAYWSSFFGNGPAWRMDVDRIFGDGSSFAVAYRFFIQKDDAWLERPGCALVTTDAAGAITEWREYDG